MLRRSVSAIVLYDAACGLCCRSAEFIATRDPAQRYRLAPLDSDAARRILAQHGLPPDQTDTVVLVDEAGRAWTRSTAALRIARDLRAPWSLLGRAGLLVPRPVRDAVYGLVSRNRRKWFGGPDACPAPSQALRARLVRDGEA